MPFHWPFSVVCRYLAQKKYVAIFMIVLLSQLSQLLVIGPCFGRVFPFPSNACYFQHFLCNSAARVHNLLLCSQATSRLLYTYDLILFYSTLSSAWKPCIRNTAGGGLFPPTMTLNGTDLMDISKQRLYKVQETFGLPRFCLALECLQYSPPVRQERNGAHIVVGKGSRMWLN